MLSLGCLCLLAGCASGTHAQKPAARTRQVTLESAPESTASKEARDISNSTVDQRAKAYAHYAAGILYEIQEQPDKALEQLAQSVLADSSNEPLAMEVARRYLRGQQPNKALEILNRVSASPSASGNVFFWLGLTYTQLAKTDQAIAAYRTALKKSPRAMAVYQSLAQLYLQNGQKKEALKTLDQAAKQPAPDANFYVDLAEVYINCRPLLGAEADTLKPKITAALDNAAKTKPKQSLLLLRLADGYKTMGDFAKAITLYRQLQDQSPRFPLLREKLADAYLRSGDKQGATEQLQAIIKDNAANSQAYYLLGSLLVDNKEYEKAADYFQKTILFDPSFEPAYFELASLQITLNRPKEALSTLEKAPSAKTQSFLVEFYTAMAYSQMEDYSVALKHLTSAELIAKTSDTNRLNHILYFQLGATYERNKDFTEAEKSFHKCLELSPNFAEALNYLGYMWAERGVNLDSARTMIEKAVKLEPDNPAYLDSLAWVLFKLNRPAEALPSMLKAINLSTKPDATLYDHLGDIYLALKEPAKARDAWRKALEVKPSDEIKKKFEGTQESAISKP